jgi:inhibitor of cysteine peptidase
MVARFLLENQSDRLDEATLNRIEQLREYELSQRAKRIEIERAIDAWLAGLDSEERREAERELHEEMRAWAADNKRQFEQTGIVAFDVEGTDGESPTVEAGATGSVPGHPLDQFSMDEHDGRLRIATTVSGAMGSDSENDLYVLDGSLSTVGSAKGMGVTERIYSVRYVGDEAYVVTFRRVDPFHVVDLSNPEEPTVEGELKLPGFSSYLHPLSEDRVLGIGEEDGKVKLVVFDVSDPSNPTVETDRILDTRWSAVAESHHAFLMDRRHGVFFLPAGDEAYVFDYGDGLDVETTVETEGRVHRTAYVGDYLYVFGDSSVTVVDERDWEETHELRLDDE